MRNITLRLIFFQTDEIMKKCVKSIAAPENVRHEVIFAGDDLSQLESADIAVFGEDVRIDAKNIRQQAKDGAILIRFIHPDHEIDLDEEEIAAFDDFWILPMHEGRLKKKLNNFILELYEKFRADMNLRWLDTLINGLSELVWFKDIDGVHLKVNDKFCESVGKSREEIHGKKHCDIWSVPPDAENACRESEIAVINSGHTMEFEEIVAIAGEKHFFKTTKSPLLNKDGQIIGTAGFGHDITNLLNLGIELDLFLEAMPFPLIICAANGTITRVNDRFLDFFGEHKDGILGFLYSDWKSRMLKEEVSPMNGDKFLRLNDGVRCVQLHEKDLSDVFGDVIGSIGIFREVTAEKSLELHLWRNANTDSLTGLANRHALGEFYKKLRPESPLHILYVDMDNFKAVNDTYGHKVGDAALKTFSAAMRSIFPHDLLVRLGGDEFLVCVTRDIQQGVLERLADKLLAKIFDIFAKDERLSKMSSSIGIRMDGHLGNESIDLLIRQADAAMYEAKKRGKGQHCVWTRKIGEV